MSTLKIGHIKTYLEKNLRSKIDLTDIQSRPKADQDKNFLSRALAAYSLMVTAAASIDDAASSITDGFDDNGIDAIYFDTVSKNLWLVQSKWISDGTGGIDNGEIEKYIRGVKNLIDTEFSRFNDKVRKRENEIVTALGDASVKIQLLIAYTGKQLSTHNLQSLHDLMDDLNDTSDLIRLSDFNIDKAHRGLVAGLNSDPINEDISISYWGYIDEPYKSYYGQINGGNLGELWKKYGRRLFRKNIRSYVGDTDVNDGIVKTITTEPESFIYFNNGITLLCNNIDKKPISGNDRNFGVFECKGISVVNGAQTLGSIGSLTEDDKVDLSKIKVFIKFISLEGSPEGFGDRITVATNTQNKVEKKDFVSLNAEQERIKVDLKLETINYHYKRTDEKITPDDSNYTLEDVTFSLAALWEDVTLTTTAKKESGKLWEDVEAKPYTDLFNSNVSARRIIKAVRVYRYITEYMSGCADDSEGREKSIYRYSNIFITHIIFQRMPQQYLADSSPDFESYFANTLHTDMENSIAELESHLNKLYPDSAIAYIFRNYTKCRELKTLMCP